MQDFSHLLKKGEETLKARLLENGRFRFIGPYFGGRIPVMVQCLECERTYERPSFYLQKPTTKCGFCYPKSGRPVKTEARDRFLSYCDTVGITVSEYHGTCKKASLVCSKGHTWQARPSSIEAGCGCPDCAVRFSATYKKVMIDGCEFEVQGYEGIALEWIVSVLKVSAKDIRSGRASVPRFKYRFSGKIRTYYPDFQIGGKIIEVKSLWTAGLADSAEDERVSLKKLQEKARAVIDAGYEFQLLLLDDSGGGRIRKKASFPDDWISMSKEQLKSTISWEVF